MLTEAKPLFASKTFWVAVLQIAGGAFTVFGNAYPTLNNVGLFAMASGFVFMLLRLQTTTPIDGILPDIDVEK